MAAQLAFDVAPAGGVAVGDRVRVLPAGERHGGLLSFRAGMTGVVLEVHPLIVPRPGYYPRLPITVAIDDLGLDHLGRPWIYAFNHEDLEVIA